VHSHSLNNDTISFLDTDEATEYFAANSCADTSDSNGGCFEQYNKGHSHSSSCYKYTICGYYRMTYKDETTTCHFKCDGCGEIAYGSISSWDDKPHQKQVLICGKTAGNAYYSTNCGHKHGELLRVLVDFS